MLIPWYIVYACLSYIPLQGFKTFKHVPKWDKNADISACIS